MALALLTMTSTTFAEESTFIARPYLGADLAYVKINDDSQSLSNELISAFGGTATASQETSKFAGRIFAGYKITENIDVELGYMQTSHFRANVSGVDSGSVAYTGSASIKVSGFDYAVLIRPSLNSGYNNLYFRIGGTNWDAKTSATLNGSTSTDTTNGGGTQYGVGYDGDITPDLKGRVAFTRYEKISGDSENYANVFSVGIFKNF